MHEEAVILSDIPCPRCGCYQRRHFKCNCGAVHCDYCDNCKRWTNLPPTEHVDLEGGFDEWCVAGKEVHEHTVAEELARIDAYFRRARPS